MRVEICDKCRVHYNKDEYKIRTYLFIHENAEEEIFKIDLCVSCSKNIEIIMKDYVKNGSKKYCKCGRMLDSVKETNDNGKLVGEPKKISIGEK